MRLFRHGWRGIAAVLLGLGAVIVGSPTPAAAAERCFAETGQCISGRFLAYWQAHGGLLVNGYPITAEHVEALPDGTVRTVQYFERARFEHHPTNPAPYDVLLGHLGRRFQVVAPPAPPLPDAVYFPATGHNLRAGFLDYWRAHGHLAQFGYPITEEFDEGGRIVQYFERARFEWHPENPEPYKVLLGLLGRRLLAETDPPLAPVCRADDLRGQVVLMGAAGSRAGFVYLINDGAAGCGLAGRPATQLLGGDGTPLPVEAREAPAASDGVVTAVALPPGGAARVALRWSNWCGSATSRLTAALTLPDGGTVRAPLVDLEGQPASAAPPCLGQDQPSQLSVGPFAAGGPDWGAVAVVLTYFQEINRRDYLAAYALLGAELQRQPFADFKAGFAGTARVRPSILFTTGTQRPDAYGVFVTLAAEQTDGTTKSFRGLYTVGPADGQLKLIAADIRPI